MNYVTYRKNARIDTSIVPFTPELVQKCMNVLLKGILIVTNREGIKSLRVSVSTIDNEIIITLEGNINQEIVKEHKNV